MAFKAFTTTKVRKQLSAARERRRNEKRRKKTAEKKDSTIRKKIHSFIKNFDIEKWIKTWKVFFSANNRKRGKKSIEVLWNEWYVPWELNVNSKVKLLISSWVAFKLSTVHLKNWCRIELLSYMNCKVLRIPSFIHSNQTSRRFSLCLDYLF